MMTMIMERTEIRPLLVKFGVVVAISFAGYLYSRNRTKRIKPSDYPHSPLPPISESDRKVDYGRFRIKDDPQPEVDSDDTYDKPCIRVRVDHASMNTSPNDTRSEDKDEFLLSEVDKLVKEFDTTTTNPILSSPKTHKRDEHEHEHEHEQEIENLKMIINFLQDRQRNLEVQLLEYYGLKEQETAMMELENLLEISNMKTKLFTMKIESLEADNVRLEAQCVDYSKVLSELEAAKAKIKLLKRKIRYENELNKEHILDLTERVVKLQEQEHEASISDSNVCLELQRLKDLECEAEELRKSNENLQQENNDLARRLESTQILAISVLEDTEKEELNKAILQLREENENLANETERIKADQCSNAEELVSLRWINACLRHELRKYQPPPGKTVARDLSKSLSPTSEKKAKQLILEYANTEDGDKATSIVDFDFDQWPSSQPSYLDELHGNSTFSNKPHFKKIKFFAKLRGLIRGKYSHHHHQNNRVSPIIRSFSEDDLGTGISFFESPQCNLNCDSRTNNQTNLNISSIEHHVLSTLAEEDVKDIEDANRMSNFSGFL